MAEIKFFYNKTPGHLEIKADGAIGGLSPTGTHIAMSVYTERHAIPRVVVQELSDDGTLGAEILEKRESKDGVVREVQATLHMDLAQAKAVQEWLTKQIEQMEVRKRESL